MLNINNEKSENILELKDITKSFGGIHALQGVTLNIKRGAIIGLIGPNGAGKTTLFNMISGFIPLDKGVIKFNQKEINNLYPYKRATLANRANLSVTENIYKHECVRKCRYRCAATFI